MTWTKRLIINPVASHLLMLSMMIFGLWGMARLNTQFLPPFDFKIVTVRTIWLGASPEDVERSITAPLEQTLRNVDYLNEMSSTSAQGVSAITLEFAMTADIDAVVNQVKQLVDEVNTLPPDAEPPVISKKVFYEKIASLMVTGFESLSEARALIHRMENGLLAAGIAKVEIRGLPDEEMAIQVPMNALIDQQSSLNEISYNIGQQSQDAPAGTVGRGEQARSLRFEEQRRNPTDFDQLVLLADNDGRKWQLGQIADIERRPRAEEALLFQQGHPAVELIVERVSDADALQAAEILQHWLVEQRQTLPPNINITVMDERWEMIAERIQLLLENGAAGFLLVVGVLYLFLHGRVAFWVAAGIPTVFLATLGVLAVMGESLNMLSLFALIMMLGIVVDDAIVVGEETFTRYQKGETSLRASLQAAVQMRTPVLCAALTTIAAFMPLLTLTDLMGQVLFVLPAIVIITLSCSLFESFFILPGHLYHALQNKKPLHRFQIAFDQAFMHWREKHYRPFLDATVRQRKLVCASGLAVLIVGVGLLLGGRVPFTFFPSPEASLLTAYVRFSAGTPNERVFAYLKQVEQALYQTEKDFGGDLIKNAVVYNKLAFSENTERSEKGDEFGTILVELIAPDERAVRNPAFIAHWESLIPPTAYLDSLNIESPRTGPPGVDIDIELTAASPAQLKAAAQALKAEVARFAGVYNIEDDLPLGRSQWILSLTPQGRALGLTTTELAKQLRGAYEGHWVQTFYDGPDEIEVRVTLPSAQRDSFARFQEFPIKAPTGHMIPLSNVAAFRTEIGMQALRHRAGQLAVHVTAEVDPAQANTRHLLADLAKNSLPQLAKAYGVNWSLQGTSHDEAVTLAELKSGTWLGMGLIYLILCWVMRSYCWPFLVLTAIPFGVVGAVFGHYLLGMDLTLLSLFGLFGLAGIVINDSIILVLRYFEHRQAGLSIESAAKEASIDRLRAVLLTSITTIAGLLPLLFETSLQAQFLIPMAAALVFGLAFSTVMVLVLIPSLIVYAEAMRLRWDQVIKQGPKRLNRLSKVIKSRRHDD